MLLQPPASEREKEKKKKKKKKKPTKTNCPLHPTRPPPKLPKISVVNKSPNEEEHLNSGAKWKKYVNIGQYVFNSNLKCWILQNVMLYFVCKIMLKLCILNVKARLLYCKANLILSLSTCQRTRQNVFKYLLSNNLKIRKESPNSSLEEKA